MDFVQYISEQVPFSETEIAQVSERTVRSNFSHKEIILPPENNSKKIYFVESGIVRVFYHFEDKEVTLYFAEENEFSVPIDSIFFQTDCKFGIQAIGDVTIAKINADIITDISNNNLHFLNFSQKLLLKTIKRFTDHIYNTHFKNPKVRFDELMESKPEIFNLVPLGFIASYLGITQETLSRLRKNQTTFD